MFSRRVFGFSDIFVRTLSKFFITSETNLGFPQYFFEIQQVRKAKEFPMKYLENQKGIFRYCFGSQINFLHSMGFLRYLYSSRKY
jgi:hypothetical protein